MPEYLDPIYSDYEQSFIEFKSLITTNYDLDSYPPARAYKKDFGIEFPGGLIRKPQYIDCKFNCSHFDASDGMLSRFQNCRFLNCTLNNCDFRYCDINGTSFISKAEASIISSCNFSYGNFIDSEFIDTQFSGCSFRQMQFENTVFKNCQIKYSSIEQSIIRNCSFVDIDMSKVGVRYCIFEKVEFKNVTFHILDLARNYGLIQLLQKKPQEVSVSYGNENVMSLEDALPRLKKLIPYYQETKQFYEMLNVYAAYNGEKEIATLLPFAFKSVISDYDFATLQDLCTLIVKYNMFTGKQLRDFFSMIKQLIIPDNFPYYLRKSYNSYIENIKHILVDNPNGYPEANILLKTDIETLQDQDISGLLTAIEANIIETAPNVSSSIQFTKHSPYEILLVLWGTMPEILVLCQMFYYSLGGAKAYSDLKNSLKEKTKNHVKKKCVPEVNDNTRSTKRIELSVGKFINFKYEKEYVKRVKSMEYTIR